MRNRRADVTIDPRAPVVFADKIPDPTVTKPRRRKDSGVGARLRELREEQKLSQVEVARRVGRDRSWISQIESGQRDPRMSTVLRIADAIGARIHIRLADHAHTDTSTKGA